MHSDREGIRNCLPILTILFPCAGWYFLPDLSHELMGGVPVNGLDEWDVAKLGWFKSRRGGGGGGGGDHAQGARQQVRNDFSARVRDCSKNDYVAEVIKSLSIL